MVVVIVVLVEPANGVGGCGDDWYGIGGNSDDIGGIGGGDDGDGSGDSSSNVDGANDDSGDDGGTMLVAVVVVMTLVFGNSRFKMHHALEL